MTPPRVAVVGCGTFGRNHLRVIRDNPRAQLAAAVDLDTRAREEAALGFACAPLSDWRDLPGRIEAAVVAVPTTVHAEVACGLLAAGIHVLVEKPIAATVEEARRIAESARQAGRVAQVGHLERFNPAMLALRKILRLPLFFEIHRMSVFAPRSIDVDVVLDLMIHDVDIVLSLTGALPVEVRAAGIRILSDKVDIANVRLAFANGCIANLTASRVSTEKVRKLRVFQPGQYISVDYARRDGAVIAVDENREVSFEQLETMAREPLAAQWDAFLDAIEGKAPVVVGVEDATRALAVCQDILAKIEVHRSVVNRTLEERSAI